MRGAAAVQASVEPAPVVLAAGLDRQISRADAAVGDLRRDRRLGVARQPQLDPAVGASQLHAALGHRREIDVEPAIGRRRVDLTADRFARGRRRWSFRR